MPTILMTILISILAGCSSINMDVKDEVTLNEAEEEDMKLFIDDQEIEVLWENNKTVKELEDTVREEPITVNMSMYGGNEQFGPLGKTYPSEDTRITTQSGDIVLYNADNIVLFYGSNTWEYTRLGHMQLSEEELRKLFAQGDVTLKLSY